ncbi:MAG: hypothetical protein M1833_006551 [Piccolia ochrophora]|nr:MAG: hypothetical protein M1833_006551 [Piccolia ochrophora]
MDAVCIQPAQAMGQAPFFYYNPDPKADHRQHGHFSPHPTGSSLNAQVQQIQQHLHRVDTGAHNRPCSSASQSSGSGHSAFGPIQTSMATIATPRPTSQKPTILVQQDSPRLRPIDTDCGGPDLFLFPSTPPLSTSGSVISTPPTTCGVLPTPVNGNAFFGLEDFEDYKRGDETEQQDDYLAGRDWAFMGSPPMTPVFVHPPSVTASQASDLLSANGCPSLSPSPSPIPLSHPAPSVASPALEFDFCDPRNLTVGSCANLTSPLTSTATAVSIPTPTSISPFDVEFPLLPTLCAGDDEEHKLMLGGGPVLSKSASAPAHFEVISVEPLNIVPSFDELSDLDSEDDFVNGLVDFAPSEHIQHPDSKRQKIEPLPFEDDNFLSEGETDILEAHDSGFAVELMGPTVSDSPRRSSNDASMKGKKNSQLRRSKKVASESESSDMESLIKVSRTKSTASSSGAARGSGSQIQQASSGQQQSSSDAQSRSGSSETNANGENPDGSAPTPAPVNRRGRKQSLTEDPSKTFVCDLCSRRFRRQEHLKRHYRSLHTHDKPFECDECGKKFSRSDNLSQHARTHGSGAILMGVLEDGELPPSEHEDGLEDGDTNAFGAALYEAAQAAAGGSTTSSDGSGSIRDSVSPPPSEGQSPQKKRKRDE